MPADAITTTGVVAAEHRGDLYEIDATIGGSTHRVLCRRSGRMITHRVRVLPGDVVTVEVNPYDTKRGRIVYRGVRPPTTTERGAR